MDSLIEPFKKIHEERYERIKRKKDEGMKVMGWVCTYCPEEIIHAAGVLPIRIVGGGTTETPMADAYMYSNTCGFVRSCLEDALKRRYDFLDGFVATNSCHFIARLYDVWNRYIDTPYKQILNIPHKYTESALIFFKKELTRFKGELEEFFQVEISDKSLKNSIYVYNEMRQLLRKLYELRKKDYPPITGAEIMQVILAGMSIPKEEYNGMLKILLDKIKNRKIPHHMDKIRIMIVGSELDDAQYIDFIETLGGLVVTDDLCNGTRYFWDQVELGEDPLEAIARRYLYRFPCPRMFPQQKRINYLKAMAIEYGVEGVIYETLKFCDLHGVRFPVFKEGFDQLGIPVLNLDRMYASGATGQTKTRVEAFFESLLFVNS